MLIRHYEERQPTEDIILCDSCNGVFKKKHAKIYMPKDRCTYAERPMKLCTSCARQRLEKREPDASK